MKLRNLGRLSVLLGFLTAGAGMGAQAADLGSTKDRDYGALDMPARWAGFFAGVGVSGTVSGGEVQSGASGPKLDMSSGWAPGGYASLGYNWQFGSWVAGVEGDISYSDNKQTGYNATLGNVTAHEYGYGSLQVRGGYAFDRVLVFATTGLELKRRQISWNTGNFDGDGVSLLVGGGVEYAIDKWWSVKTEAKFFGAQEKGLQFNGGNRDMDQGFGAFSLGVARKF